MKILCPHCGFSKEVDPAKLPAGAKKATCPKCKNKFDLPDRPAAAATPPPFQPAEKPGPAVPPPVEDLPPRMAAGPDHGPEFGAPPMPPQFPSDYDDGASGRSGIPWEDRTGGFFGDLFSTIFMILLHPGDFFSKMPVRGGYKAPLIFCLVCSVFMFLISVVWVVVATMFQIPMMGGMPPEFSQQFGINFAAFQFLYLGIVVILLPVIVIVVIFIMAAILHVFLIIVRGAGAGYEATFRVAAYATASQLFGIVPVIGGLIAAIYNLVLCIMGFSRAHQTSAGKVILAIIILPCFLCILVSVGVPLLISSLLPH